MLFDVVMVSRDYVSLRIGKVVTHNAVRVGYKNTCGCRVQLLADLLLRIPVSWISAGLALGWGCHAACHYCYLATEVELLVGDSHSWSLYRRLEKRAQSVITSCPCPYLRSHKIFNLLRAVPSACCSSRSSVAYYPSLRMLFRR